MTTPSTRGDALADALLAAFHEREDGAISADEFEARVIGAHDAYRASQVEGERVRLAVYRCPRFDRPDIIEARSEEWHDEGPPLCYIVATIPPRTTPPSVEGSVVQ